MNLLYTGERGGEGGERYGNEREREKHCGAKLKSRLVRERTGKGSEKSR